MSDMAARGSPQLATEKKYSIVSSLRKVMAKFKVQELEQKLHFDSEGIVLVLPFGIPCLQVHV